MNIYAKFMQWPERARIPLRLHLYDGTGRYRADLSKLLEVFELAGKYGIQAQISTNLNCLNAVYIDLDNYVLRLKDNKCAHAGGWGNYWGFLLALVRDFPAEVYIDPPEGTPEHTKGTRFALAGGGEIAYEIQTWDDV